MGCTEKAGPGKEVVLARAKRWGKLWVFSCLDQE